MSPVFQPPSHDVVPPVPPRSWPGQDPAARRLFAHYKPKARGRTVLKINGSYATYEYPLQSQLDAATEVYLGGHVYTVSVAVGNALTAAGYSVT